MPAAVGCARRTLLCTLALFPLSAAADLHGDWFTPRAADFAAASAPLAPAIEKLCAAHDGKAELQDARAGWLSTLTAWERFSSVAVGPLLQQRLQRRLDFTPTRPKLIARAVKAAPQTLADLERIGTPAKGIPALQWLMWAEPSHPNSPECRYAALLAAELTAEANALAAATAKSEPAPLAEVVNQWVAGLERLRWSQMEMPLRVALTSGGAPDYPRGSAADASWAAQWQALRAVAAGLPQTPADPAAAQAFQDALAKADAAMTKLSTSDAPERILAAAARLAELKRLMEERIAPALGVAIGFSDSDGD